MFSVTIYKLRKEKNQWGSLLLFNVRNSINVTNKKYHCNGVHYFVSFGDQSGKAKKVMTPQNGNWGQNLMYKNSYWQMGYKHLPGNIKIAYINFLSIRHFTYMSRDKSDHSYPISIFIETPVVFFLFNVISTKWKTSMVCNKWI